MSVRLSEQSFSAWYIAYFLFHTVWMSYPRHKNKLLETWSVFFPSPSLLSYSFYKCMTLIKSRVIPYNTVDKEWKDWNQRGKKIWTLGENGANWRNPKRTHSEEKKGRGGKHIVLIYKNGSALGEAWFVLKCKCTRGAKRVWYSTWGNTVPVSILYSQFWLPYIETETLLTEIKGKYFKKLSYSSNKRTLTYDYMRSD